VSERVAYGVVLAVTALVTLLVTPIFRYIAQRTGAIVAPDERRIHERPTPLLGGAAMLVGFLTGMLVAYRLDVLNAIFTNSSDALGVIIAGTLMLVIGTVDDVREVSPPAKVAGIVLCSSVLVFFGVSLLVFRVPFEGVFYPDPNWSFLLSVLWVLGMTNAINLIDGLDGLAAGIVAIAAGSFFLYSMQLNQQGLLQAGNIAPLLSVIVLGMCIGFLPWNFHPARIFMGDGGALMLGLLMAASTMTVGGRVDQQCVDSAVRQCSGQTYFFFAPLVIPLFILGVPIFDTLLAIVRRATRRTGVASADKEHIHHRLMRLGHGQRRSVIILWSWSALLSIMVLYPIYSEGRGNGLVPVGVAALGLALFTVLHPGARSSRAERRSGASDQAAAEGTEAGFGPARGTGSSQTGSRHASRARRGVGHRQAATAEPERATSPAEALAALDLVAPNPAPGDPEEPSA
jgi:UDP-GlcNAc:undecaprenyl-phosphate GlcNAc-1-phosphate transferase